MTLGGAWTKEQLDAEQKKVDVLQEIYRLSQSRSNTKRTEALNKLIGELSITEAQIVNEFVYPTVSRRKVAKNHREVAIRAVARSKISRLRMIVAFERTRHKTLTQELRIGVRVEKAGHGPGTIIRVHADYHLAVRFDSGTTLSRVYPDSLKRLD